MQDTLREMRSPFRERIGLPALFASLFFGMSRPALTALLAAVPSALVLTAAWVGPRELAFTLTRPDNVHDVFARFLTAVATASAIAVSVATLTLRRELSGIRSVRQSYDANEDLRERVRRLARQSELPLSLPDFLAALLRATAQRCRMARDVSSDGLLAESEMGVPLRDYLATLEERALETAQRIADRRANPDRTLLALLDFEEEVTHAVLRRFLRREDVSEAAVREHLQALRALLEELSVASHYAKTLDIQWGLSRMSRAILLTTLPAVVASAAMIFFYGDATAALLSLAVASLLVCVALAVVLVPLAAFVAYLLRFVVINQHTLPTHAFVVGPEQMRVVEHGIGNPRR